MPQETIPIRWLKDKDSQGNKTKFFPRTHVDAVKDDDGTPLSTILEKYGKQLVTEDQMETLITNGTWVEGVTYYTIEEE